MGETGALHVLRHPAQFLMTRDLVFRDIQPSQPLAFVRPGPERGITLPQSPHLSVSTPIVNRGLNRSCQSLWQNIGLLIYFWRNLALAALLYRFQKFVECVGEESDTVFCKFVSYLLHRDSDLWQRLHSLLRSVDVFRQALARHAVIAEGIQCGGRHSVYGIRTNQFLDIEDIAIIRIFGAGASPEHALSLRPLGSQSLPARSAKNLLIALVS